MFKTTSTPHIKILSKHLHSLKNILIFFSLLFVIVESSFANNIKNPQIKYGYPEQSIFIATINGQEQPITPMLNVAEELFKQANLSWEASAYPAKRLFRNFEDGTTNFSILVRASSLLESCVFSEKPIYSTNLNIYYIGDKPPVLSKEDLIGKSVVSIRGYSYGKLRKFLEDPDNNITNSLTNTHYAAFKMLGSGRADYLLDYASAAEDVILQNPIANLRSHTLSTLDIFLVLSKSYPNAEILMKKFEKIANSMDINSIMKKTNKN